MVKNTDSQDVLSTLKTFGCNFVTWGRDCGSFKLFVVDMPVPNFLWVRNQELVIFLCGTNLAYIFSHTFLH